jgi:hypothetical protein
MSHDKHKMVMMHSHLGGRSRGDNMADSSNGSLHAKCIPLGIGKDLVKSFVGKCC